MSNVKVIQARSSAKTSQLVKKTNESHVPVVVTMDGITRSSVATIKKDMSEAVKRDLKVLRQFGLVTS